MTRTLLVTDAGRTSAIAFIRSLGRQGWRVVAGDSDPRSPGFRSRYVSERFLYPAPQDSPRAFVAALRARLERSPIDLVVPITDECIHPIAHARAELEPLARLAIADARALATVTDKRATLELARSLGVPVPPTRVVRTVAEARAAAAGMSLPLVLKPAVSRLYFPEEDRIEPGAVRFAHDAAELEHGMRALEGRHEVLLQSYVEGVGVGVECLARDGEVLRAFQHRRLAEIPICGGASAWRESVPLDPTLFTHARALVAALGWTGLVMVEFKLGERPWLLEINGRVWGSLPLACLCGVDFPAELAALDFPSDVRTSTRALGEYRVGVRAYNFELMLSWITQVLLGRTRHPYLPRPGRERAVAGILGLLDPSQKSDLSGGRDLAPRLAEARRIVRKFAGKLAGAQGDA